MKVRLSFVVGAIIAAAVGSGCGDPVEIGTSTVNEQLAASLSGDQEPTPVPTAATGSAQISIVNDTFLTVRVDVASIDSTTASHIHAGEPGVSGPVIVTLFTGASSCRATTGTAIAIDTARVGNPTTIKTKVKHNLATDMIVRIANDTATSTPPINADHRITVTGDSTFTIPVNVTVAGRGGTVQRTNPSNGTSPRCQVGYTGPLALRQFTPSQLTDSEILKYGTTPQARWDSLMVLLHNGNAYVNVHNRANTGGHIRGQVVVQ